MSWDNKVFNVNGRGLDMLRAALQLAYQQNGEKTTAKAWKFIPEAGFVLLWWNDRADGSNAFPCPMNAEAVAPMIIEWLASEDAKGMKCSDWDADTDHDGHNSKGWRIYTGDWGHINDITSAICAVRPAYLWHGK